MRRAAVPSLDALRGSVRPTADVAPVQPVDGASGATTLPIHVEHLVAHLRLLVGVPLPYLVPDGRLLPPESLRFFYLDRSWTDRVVDGALSVGKSSSWDQGHHHRVDAELRAGLDVAETHVRTLQRGLPLATATGRAGDGLVTGLILRSMVVREHPHMEVRAFREPVAEGADAATVEAAALPLLRLERLAPSILLALFDGVPRLVWLEEPSHDVPIGFDAAAGARRLHTLPQIPVPFRAGGKRVVDVATLRRSVLDADPSLPRDAGSGAMTRAMLGGAHRERFENGADPGGSGPVRPERPVVEVSASAGDPRLAVRLRELIR
jgi:hypothetical protein